MDINMNVLRRETVVSVDDRIVARVVNDLVLDNFLKLLNWLLGGSDTTWVYTDGSSPSSPDKTSIDVKAGEGVDSYGILVGSGTTSPSPTDYTLESQILHGSGDSNLYYNATSISSVVSGQGFTVSRRFDYKGTQTITVSEVGLAVKILDGGVEKYLLLTRDVISSITMAPGSYITVTYTISPG